MEFVYNVQCDFGKTFSCFPAPGKNIKVLRIGNDEIVLIEQLGVHIDLSCKKRNFFPKSLE